MFTVVTDQYSTAISVQAVDDAGYSLYIGGEQKLKFKDIFYKYKGLFQELLNQ